jgi:hypothetical protein
MATIADRLASTLALCLWSYCIKFGFEDSKIPDFIWEGFALLEEYKSEKDATQTLS